MTFRSLYRLERARAARLPGDRRRGRRLDRSTSCASTPATSIAADRRAASTRRCSSGSPQRLRYVSGDFGDDADLRRGSPRRSATPSNPASTWRSRRRCSRRWSPGLAERRARPATAGGSSSRSRSATTSRRRARSPRDLHKYVDESQLYRIDHFLGQDGARGDPLPALRQHDARAGVEPQLRRARSRSRWPRASASRTAATSTTRSARCATSSSTTCCRSRRRSRWSRPRAATPTRSKDAKHAVFARCRTPTPSTTCAASTTGYREIDGVARRLDHRDLRRAAARDRQLALGRRAVLHPHRQAPAGHARPRCGWCSSTRRGCPSSRAAAAGPSPSQIVVRIDPQHRDPDRARRAPRRQAGRAPRSSSTWSSRSEGGEGATPYEVLLHAALVGDATPLHPPGQRRGELADRAAAARRAAAGASPTRRARGAPRRPTSWSPDSAAGAGPGCPTERCVGPAHGRRRVGTRAREPA